MTAATLLNLWPELLLIAISLAVLRLLVALSGARGTLGNLRRLHGDQQGGVQTLSFVLTVPLFLFIMMFIVQLSQLTIAKVVVEYAAIAAARSASVWIPAHTGTVVEDANRISQRQLIASEMETGNDEYWLDDERPLDVVDPRTWGQKTRYVYRIEPSGPKYQRIRMAAVMACASICPSREIAEIPPQAEQAADAMLRAYAATTLGDMRNPRIPSRLRNKIAYAMANTEVELEVRHKDSEPPLWLLRTPWNDGYWYNEIGWQDELTVTVTHHFALLPGPGRLLARRADAPPGTEPEASYSADDQRDPIARQIGRRGRTYVYSLTATARATNEGHIPARPYHQRP